MWLRDRVRLLEDREEYRAGEISGINKRLNMLECDHDYIPTMANRYYGTGALLGKLPVMKCSKCGHVLSDITKEEFYTTRIENDKEALAKLKKDK